MLSFDQASAILRDAARPIETIEVPVADAHGLVLAGDVTARIDSPRADVSAMDGYAVREADLPGPFRLAGVSSAGSVGGGEIEAGEAMRIFTGAHLPPGADRVLVQEIVTREGDAVRLSGEYGANRHIRRRGSDYAAGDTLLAKGTRIDHRSLVLLAGADRATVPVWRRPRVAVLSTGDELAAPGSAVETPGSLPESVSFGVAALARQWGGAVVLRQSVKDDPAAIARIAGEALQACDVLVMIGGASVGERDFAHSALAGGDFELLFAKAAIRPGKPVWAARNTRGRFVVGLPGNPTSAMVTARLFLAPLLRALAGGAYADGLQWRTVPLARSLPAPGEREHFARARHENGQALPLTNQQSSSQSSLALADLLIRQAGGSDGIAQGEAVPCLDF